MSASIFARTLASAAMVDVFAEAPIVEAMLEFEAALAEAEAAEGVIPASAAAPIAPRAARAFDVEALVAEARRAGSLAIPLVKQLTAGSPSTTPRRPAYVHRGSTSQDVIDTRDGARDAARARADRRRARASDRRRCSRSPARHAPRRCSRAR